MSDFSAELNALRAENRLRELRPYGREGMKIRDEDGREYVDFSSNDYLGLSQHPRLIQAAQEGVENYGVGSTASRLISGTTPAHHSFEERLAREKGTEASLLFSSGFLTALSVIPAIVGKEDVILMDKLAHACLIDGVRASGARLRVFPHNDLNKLESLLISEREKLSASGKILIIAESVYSMDGDLCPLKEMVELKERHGAWLLLDEAHGLGVLGKRGLGLAEELDLQERIEFQMGTLGKAAGGAGGYLCSSGEVKDLIINKGRGFIFTTAPPPVQAVVAEKALELITSLEGETLRNTLRDYRNLIGKAHGGRPLPSAIHPILIGENTETLEASASLREKGFLLPGIRYPTVPKGSARLRVTLSAGHTLEEIEKLSTALSELKP